MALFQNTWPQACPRASCNLPCFFSEQAVGPECCHTCAEIASRHHQAICKSWSACFFGNRSHSCWWKYRWNEIGVRNDHSETPKTNFFFAFRTLLTQASGKFRHSEIYGTGFAGYSRDFRCQNFRGTSFFQFETHTVGFLSLMIAETVSLDIVTKEWLKSGLAEGINYTDFIKINAR